MRIHTAAARFSTNFLLSSEDASILELLKGNVGNGEFVPKLLNRRWALSCPDSSISQILILDRNGGALYKKLSNACLGEQGQSLHFPSFYVVRDDLLHPLVNGNKARKLDAILPLLEDNVVTDVVTCGGIQSAHAAAVAVSCAERGLKSHLLLRGEEPDILTGYSLVSKLYGNVVYVPRSLYANRESMLMSHAKLVVGSEGSIFYLKNLLEDLSSCHAHEKQNHSQEDNGECLEKSIKVVIINEGAGDSMALLGLMRLVQYLSQDHVFGKHQALKIVVDAGTGTTAVGLGLGALFLGLPWEIIAIMLADNIDGYKEKEQYLTSEFLTTFTSFSGEPVPSGVNAGIVHWVERTTPRKFGKILKGEVEECQKIASQTGILVDPMYTLSTWELATQLCKNNGDDAKVVVLHTGGTLGMFGIAQRWKSDFQTQSKDAN